MTGIGPRLRQERQRLKLSQSAMAPSGAWKPMHKATTKVAPDIQKPIIFYASSTLASTSRMS